MFFLIPENLNLVDDLTSMGCGRLLKHQDKFFDFIDVLYRQSHISNQNKNTKKITINKTFFPRHRDYLRKRYGQDSNKKWLGKIIIDTLLRLRYIESRNYSAGRFSYSYRLSNQMFSQDFRKVTATDSKFIKKIEKFKKDRMIYKTDIEKAVFDKLHELDLDFETAYDFVETIEDNNKYISYKIAASNFQDRHFFVETDRNGRIHTNITNLPKVLRRFLSWEGERLIEIDISNAQPFFLNELLIDYSYNDQRILDSTRNFQNTDEFYTEIQNTTVQCTDKTNPNPCTSPYVVDFFDQHYIEHTVSGSFYDMFQEHLNFSMSLDYSRAQVKTVVMGIFNGDESRRYYDRWVGSEAKIFENLFSNTLNVIREWKVEDHKRLSNKLQRIEADLMIKGVFRRILQQNPHVPIYTIHDGLLTIPAHAVYVESVIRDECAKVFGIVPKIIIKHDASAE